MTFIVPVNPTFYVIELSPGVLANYLHSYELIREPIKRDALAKANWFRNFGNHPNARVLRVLGVDVEEVQ
jgi:hypothetical protein